MSRTDLVADSFTMIRNALRIRREDVSIPYSGSLLKICEILKNEGYIENLKEIDVNNRKFIKVYLKYDGKKSVINEIKRVSKPGRRIYITHDKIHSVLQGHGIGIISTSSGILTDKDARAKGVGGEYVGLVW